MSDDMITSYPDGSLVSVAMATYNGEKFVKEQIESVLNQSYHDIELVIGDDCSTDNTFQIIKEFGLRDDRIRFFQNSVNLGFLKNFEKIITQCKGKYIALCDQDDIWYPNHIDRLLQPFSDKEVLLSGANAQVVGADNKELGFSVLDMLNVKSIPRTEQEFSFFLLHRNLFQGAASIIDCRLLQYALPIPHGVFFHDWWFSLCATAYGSVAYSDECVLNYRQHGSNQTENKSFQVVKRIVNFFQEGKDAKEKNDVLRQNEMLQSFLNTFCAKSGCRHDMQVVRDAISYYKNYDHFSSFPYFLRHYNCIYRNTNFFIKILRVIKRLLYIIRN